MKPLLLNMVNFVTPDQVMQILIRTNFSQEV